MVAEILIEKNRVSSAKDKVRRLPPDMPPMHGTIADLQLYGRLERAGQSGAGEEQGGV